MKNRVDPVENMINIPMSKDTKFVTIPTKEEIIKDETSSYDHLRVLVVDDSTAIQKVMKRWFETHGCIVTIAENGKVGLNKLKEQSFDITFMDFLMVRTYLSLFMINDYVRFVPNNSS